MTRQKRQKIETTYGEGVLEILPEGFGFLRSPAHNYLPSPNDIYISSTQISKFKLRPGVTVRGLIRSPKDNERHASLYKVEMVNNEPPENMAKKLRFDDLTPLFPENKIKLSEGTTNTSMRIVDMLTPIGKGQRGMVVAPPRSGKTILLQNIAHSVTRNHPEIYLMILLINERPEEVTDMRKNVKGEVISCTFDESANKTHSGCGDSVRKS